MACINNIYLMESLLIPLHRERSFSLFHVNGGRKLMQMPSSKYKSALKACGPIFVHFLDDGEGVLSPPLPLNRRDVDFSDRVCFF